MKGPYTLHDDEHWKIIKNLYLNSKIPTVNLYIYFSV